MVSLGHNESNILHADLVFNSLLFYKCELISWIDSLSTSRKIGLSYVPQNPIDDKTAWIQVKKKTKKKTEWTEWTGMTFWQLHGPPRSRPATLSVRSTLYSELSDYGHHSQFAVHHPDLTFESGVYVRPVIYRGSDSVYGDSLYCVYQHLWGRRVTEHRWYYSTPPDLCTHDQIRWISYVCAQCFPVDTNCSHFLTHSCTDEFSLCHHPELPLYTI